MMTDAPDKKEFHFSGDGIWRNKAILAETREEAEKIWHSVKQLVNPEKPPVKSTRRQRSIKRQQNQPPSNPHLHPRQRSKAVE